MSSMVQYSNFDGRGIGLANATNTNTDTSGRIHTTARVCVSLYNSLVDPTIVSNNKHEFRAIKEEIALGIGRPYCPMGVSYESRGLAPVVTNVAAFNSGKADDYMRWLVRFYDCRSRKERKAHCATGCTVKGQMYYPSDLYLAGIVISDAEADPQHGDTALTLMIGGKITIRNGHFSVQTGDIIQWYFEEEVEAGMFDSEGLRIKRRPNGGNFQQPVEYINPIPKEQKKVRDYTYAERAAMKQCVMIKPCLMGLDGRGASRGDVTRCFAIACSNAGSYERVDIKICRQSM